MAVEFSSAPTMFGAFHIGWLIGIAAAAVLFFFVFRKLPEKALMHIIFGISVFMVLAEIWKQIFSYIYVYGHQVNMWYFPWQLCDIAMYLGVSLPLLKGKARETDLVFLGTFSLFAAVMALAVPGDMLRIQILLAAHGFLYHGLMILQSMAAIFILRKRLRQNSGSAAQGFWGNVRAFFPAALLFLGTAVIAEAINILSHVALHDRKREPNMFNITPYYESTQPVFHEIALAIGIIPEIFLYLFLIILVAFGIFSLIRIRKND